MQRVVYAGQQYQNDVLCSVVLSRGKYSTNNYNNNNGGSSKRSSNDMLNNQIRNTTNERVSLYIVRYTPVPGQKTALNDDNNEQAILCSSEWGQEDLCPTRSDPVATPEKTEIHS